MKAISALIAFLGLLFYLVFPGKIAAVTTQSLSVGNISSLLDQSQEMEVNVSFVCPSCSSDSYLRGVFYPSGTSYFGFTQDNNGNWSNASGANCTTFFKVAQTDFNKEGTWSGKLKIKPDKDSVYYNGPGEYLFKIGRYTPSCSSPSVWSLESTIAITGPTPTPTSLPSMADSPTSTPIPTPTPTLKPTNTPIPVTKVVTPTNSFSKTQVVSGSGVLGANDLESSSPTPSNRQEKKLEVLSATDNKLLPKLFIFLGIVFIILCAIVIFYPKLEEFVKLKKNE